jgi:hypothetical protein
METNEVLVVIERGFAELRSEFVQRIDDVRNELGGVRNELLEHMDHRFEYLDGRIEHLDDLVGRVKMDTESIRRDDVRQIAEGQAIATARLDRHLQEGGAPLEERVVKLEIRVDTLEKRPRRSQR